MTVNATNFRKNLFDILGQAVKYNEVVNVTTREGNAVILSEADYIAIMETLYLHSVPGLTENLLQLAAEPMEPAKEPSASCECGRITNKKGL